MVEIAEIAGIESSRCLMPLEVKRGRIRVWKGQATMISSPVSSVVVVVVAMSVVGRRREISVRRDNLASGGVD